MLKKNLKYIIVVILIIIMTRKPKLINGQLTKNFHLDEFRSKDGAQFPEDVKLNLLELAQNLQYLRDMIGEPIYINSGYRSIKHNVDVGGEKNSYHTKGMAADIHVKGLKPKELALIIEQAINNGKIKQGGLGIYPTFVHYDIQGKKVRWYK